MLAVIANKCHVIYKEDMLSGNKFLSGSKEKAPIPIPKKQLLVDRASNRCEAQGARNEGTGDPLA
jgi:hypothetical protein